MIRPIILFASSLLLLSFFSSCEHDAELPPVVDGVQRPICYETQVNPIIANNCAYSGCHDGSSEFALNTIDDVRSKIKAGDPNASELYQVIVPNRFTRITSMPPKPHKKLTSEEVTLIELWILEEKNSFSNVILPLFVNHCATSGCHVGQDAPNGVELTNYVQIRNAVENNNLVKHITADPDYSLMPPDTNLYDSYVQKINQWISDGFPNN